MQCWSPLLLVCLIFDNLKKNKNYIGILFIEDTLSDDLVTEALLQRNSLGIVFRNAALIRSTRGLTALKDDDEIVFRIFGTNCVGNPPGTKALPHNICLLFLYLINVACFRRSRQPVWTLLGAKQIWSRQKMLSRLVFDRFLFFLTSEETDCPLMRLGPK